MANVTAPNSTLIKTNGTGAPVAAVAGTDYLAPSGSGAALTGITASQVGAVASTTVTECVKLTAAEYAALGTKVATTLYVIVG